LDVNRWLSSYFDNSYFWYALSPRPNPAAAPDLDTHFQALLFQGSSVPVFPADRWSRYESTESFNRFYGDGATLGFGVSVAGLEVTGQPGSPLYVRNVDSGSPAAGVGLQRGDRILALNDLTADQILEADDFSALTATQAGQALTVQWRTAAGLERSASLSAAVYLLTPVPAAQVLQTAGGRPVGYLDVRNMIDQASGSVESAFAQFQAAGAQDVVLDLRYNGGGLVSFGGKLASYIAGLRGSGKDYARLLYNDKQASLNQTVRFSQPSHALNLQRVFVLAGRRTCSASEQVINGLRGAGVEVISVGETTCGKPVGFLPQADGCGNTHSIVNFESVNHLGQGRYFDGFDASCQVAEDFTQPLAGVGDPLTSTALALADGGQCPAAASRPGPLAARLPDQGQRQRPGMDWERLRF
jgi:hypothetical protein